MVEIKNLFTLENSLAGDYLKRFVYPWEALEGLSRAIAEIGQTLGEDYKILKDGVWIHKNVTLSPSAQICPPSIICDGAEIRHCAFIRGSALVGRGCVVGNSTELKNVILFDGSALPHFNYAGDSVIGAFAHLGAGAITSNVKADKQCVVIHGGRDYSTGRRKVGAFVGDGAEIGCNSVLTPGSVVGKNSIVYPLSCVRGCVPANSIYKCGGIFPRS